MTRSELFQQIVKKNSYLCVGLDTDIRKIPTHLLSEPDPVFAFNKQIIDATHNLCVAYKPNLAFYEALGPKGWESLYKTVDYIPDDLFVIADAKRGDIGNTSDQYARAFFDEMDFDAITISPYMGSDSVTPYLSHEGKWVVLLAHTSNPGSADFQLIKTDSGKQLYEEVIIKSQQWASPDQLMYVVGATQVERLEEIRKLAPDYFFLVPGVGTQGGDLQTVSQRAMNTQCGLLVNSSRAIIYASDGKDFARQAATAAQKVQIEMKKFLEALA